MVHCVVAAEGRLLQVVGLMQDFNEVAQELFTLLWLNKDVPSSVFAFRDRLKYSSDVLYDLMKPNASAEDGVTLTFLLTHYPDVDLHKITP